LIPVKVKFGYKSDRAIRDIWNRYKAQVMADEPLRIERKQGSGRKLKHLPEELQNKIRNTPLPNRRTIRSLSFHSGIPKSTLRFQPPNSPDLNILDLAQFRAMQSLQQQYQTKNIDELIAVVQNCWNEFPLQTSKKVWTSLQMVMNAVIAAGGRNSYKLPHMGKEKWIRENGELPLRLECTALTQPAAAAAPPTPPANNHAQAADAEGSTSPTSIMQGDQLTIDFHNLSLEAVAEDDLWESLGDELEWDDGAGHGEDDAVVDGLDVGQMEQAGA
jgi:hypothetical protein